MADKTSGKRRKTYSGTTRAKHGKRGYTVSGTGRSRARSLETVLGKPSHAGAPTREKVYRFKQGKTTTTRPVAGNEGYYFSKPKSAVETERSRAAKEQRPPKYFARYTRAQTTKPGVRPRAAGVARPATFGVPRTYGTLKHAPTKAPKRTLITPSKTPHTRGQIAYARAQTKTKGKPLPTWAQKGAVVSPKMGQPPKPKVEEVSWSKGRIARERKEAQAAGRLPDARAAYTREPAWVKALKGGGAAPAAPKAPSTPQKKQAPTNASVRAESDAARAQAKRDLDARAARIEASRQKAAVSPKGRKAYSKPGMHQVAALSPGERTQLSQYADKGDYSLMVPLLRKGYGDRKTTALLTRAPVEQRRDIAQDLHIPTYARDENGKWQPRPAADVARDIMAKTHRAK